MKPILLTLGLVGALCAPSWIQAQVYPNPSELPVHQEFRQLRDGLMAAMNKGDLEALLPFLHTNVVVTWHNAEVSRGHAGVRAYYNRVMTGPSKIVESFTCDLNVDELTILHGNDTGTSFGSSNEHFKLAGGRELNVKGRWTGTLVKENGRWLVASLHASTNLFDNVLLDLAKKLAWLAGGVCLVVGLLLGWLLGRRRKTAA